MVEFKVGDKVRRINWVNFNMDIGDTGIITCFNGDLLRVKPDNGGEEYGHDKCNLELVSRNNKKVKVKPIELHVVLENGCNNFVNLKDNYEDATKQSVNEGKTYTIYKLVAVAKIENAVKVTKIKVAKK